MSGSRGHAPPQRDESAEQSRVEDPTRWRSADNALQRAAGNQALAGLANGASPLTMPARVPLEEALLHG